MAENYGIAAVRHYQDAKLLEESRRVSNADQFFGIAAECAIKSALVALPAFARDGRLHPTHLKHIDRLWDSIPAQSLHRRYPKLVAAMQGHSPFADWSTDQRYASDGEVTVTALKSHGRVARRILGSVGLLGTRAGAL